MGSVLSSYSHAHLPQELLLLAAKEPGTDIQMAQPLSGTSLLLLVPRGACPPLHFWRRKLGFATSEEEEVEVFKGSLLWCGEALLLPVSSKSSLVCLATTLVGIMIPLLEGKETVIYSVECLEGCLGSRT